MKRVRLRMPTGEIDLYNPRREDVRLLDIAKGLSMLCVRNVLETEEHYSLAQRSVIISDNVPTEFKLVALLHHAVKAYIGDVPDEIAAGWSRTEREHEDRFRDVIGSRFGVDLRQIPECVQEADQRTRSTEIRDLMRRLDSDPDEPRYAPWNKVINPSSAELAREEFIGRFHECGGKTH